MRKKINTLTPILAKERGFDGVLMNKSPFEDKHLAPLVIIVAGLLFLLGMSMFM